MSELVISYPSPEHFVWWEGDPPTQASMERHVGVHIKDPRIRERCGIPLYDLEVCAAMDITLPETEKDLVEMAKTVQPEYDAQTFARRTLLVGAYLGVMSVGSVKNLPVYSRVRPYRHTHDVSFMQAVAIKQGYDIRNIVPYNGNLIRRKDIIRPDFEPFRIVVAGPAQ
jgi:hypothetical protein